MTRKDRFVTMVQTGVLAAAPLRAARIASGLAEPPGDGLLLTQAVEAMVAVEWAMRVPDDALPSECGLVERAEEFLAVVYFNRTAAAGSWVEGVLPLLQGQSA